MRTNSRSGFSRFVVLWLGEWVSSIGSGLTAFVLGIYVFQQTGTAASVSMVTLCAFLPSILLSPISGVLADRYDRRLLMILGDLGSAAGLFCIVGVMLTGELQVWHICVGMGISSVFGSLLDPAYKASITDLLGEQQYARASGMVQLAAASKYLLSPVLAGQLLMVLDIQWILILDIGTFAVTIFAIAAVRRQNTRPAQPGEVTASPSAPGLVQPADPNRSAIGELMAGWRMVRSETGVLLLTGMLAAVTFNVGFVQTLFTPLLLPLTDADTLGTVLSISATGLLAGSLIVGILHIERYLLRFLSLGLVMAGLFLMFIGASVNVVIITAAAFLFFSSLPFVNTSAEVLIRRTIPNEAQGRAWGIIGILSQTGYVVAYAVAGPAADRWFNPLLEKGGKLAASLGAWIGTGAGRGIGFMLILLGAAIVLIAWIVSRLGALRELERRA
ncbi:MFS transporter [Paenibacillus sp. CN-4]|uniref:MFS transporter n=1 Tax=Paenibacillus nanchangensis TaxID=3348343 RepID=UPI003977EA1E